MAKKKVSFSLAAEIVGDATTGVLVGEFNNWDTRNGVELKKAKDGSLGCSVSLETGQTYQYRYLLDDGRWVNDGNADDYSFIGSYQVDNCVISVPLATPKKAKKVAAKPAAKVSKPAAKGAKSDTDDLTKIEGIGKKIEELLIKDGITTYALLGKATQKKLKDILIAAGSRYQMHDPKTWPKQSKLAATGKWEQLSTLQGELKGGK